MRETPDVLLLHTASASHWMDADRLAEAVADRLPETDVRVATTPAASAERIDSATVALAAGLPRDLLDAATDLRWVQSLSAGVDFYPLDELRERGVILTSAAGIHAEPIAEQAFGYMLLFERELLRGLEQQRRGVWERYEGGELAGKTLGIVGVGSIGRRVAALGDAFGMTVVGTKRETDVTVEGVDRLYPPSELFAVLERSDYLVVACPLTAETRGLLGRDELGAMPDGAVLVNVARGPVVDEAALTAALQQRSIRGAALDVFDREPLPPESPLWNLSNVVITPHMAGSTPKKERRCAELFARNYRAFAAGDEAAMENRVP